MTSSSEFHDEAATEDYFGSRTSRESERADPCPTFDPISAFYAPKTTEHQEFDAAASSETQKNSQKTSMMIDNLLSVRSQESCLPDMKQ